MSCGSCRGVKRDTKLITPVSTVPIYNPKDSSITFSGEVEHMVIEDYSIDPGDPNRLVSNMPLCDTRMTGIMLQQDGTYKPFHSCMGDCDNKGKQVNLDICNACPLSKALPV